VIGVTLVWDSPIKVRFRVYVPGVSDNTAVSSILIEYTGNELCRVFDDAAAWVKKANVTD